MNASQFYRLFNFLQGDKTCYIIPEKLRFISATDDVSKIKEELYNLGEEFFLRVNINIRDDYSFTLQNVVLNKSKSNSIIVRESVLLDISERLSINISMLLLKHSIICGYEADFYKQKERKIASLKNREYNSKLKKITFANKKTPKTLVEWSNITQDYLINNQTRSERLLYKALYNEFNDRVTFQHPFLINGKLYYADISIPSLKVIIEVDGGYHNTIEQKEKDKRRDEAFLSIGYVTLRYNNEDVLNTAARKNIVKRLIEMDNTN